MVFHETVFPLAREKDAVIFLPVMTVDIVSAACGVAAAVVFDASITAVMMPMWPSLLQPLFMILSLFFIRVLLNRASSFFFLGGGGRGWGWGRVGVGGRRG